MNNWNSEEAHIVYAADNRFAEILGVSLVSLFENNKDMGNIIVYIFDNDICNENKNRIEEIFRIYNRKPPIWIKCLNITEILSMRISVDRGSLSQYARLFIARNLPDGLTRVLYLDCDIIIEKSIKELWNIDLHGMTIGALKDAFSKYYRANINLLPNDIMFNSGVMLIDLVRWKEQNIEEKLLEFITQKKGKIQQGDQGALNAVLSKDTYCLNPKYNSVTIFYDFSYSEMMIYRKPPKDYYTEEQIKIATEDPTIVHFTTSFLSKRPWVEGCKHRYVEEWLKYKKISPWKENALWNDEQTDLKKCFRKIYHCLPTCISVRIAGLAQAYGRPMLNRIKG